MGLWKALLSLFKSPSPTKPKMSVAFPYEAVDSVEWKNRLGAAVNQNNLTAAEIEGTHVYRLEIWKRDIPPFHELLLAYIVNPDVDELREPVCMYIDRTVPDDAPNPVKAPLRGCPGGFPVELGVTQENHCRAGPVSKNLSPSPQATTDIIAGFSCHLIQTCIFHADDQPLLVDLVAAAEALTQFRESYDLLDAQCFWYSGTLFLCMARIVTAAPSINVKSATELDEMTVRLKSRLRTVKEMKHGHFHWLKIFDPEKVNTDELKLLIATKKAEIMEMLYHKESARVARGDQALREAERRIAEVERETAEVERKAAESERKVVESERKAAESERKAAEAEERMRELERRLEAMERLGQQPSA
ncbi:hypothetical protein BD779DRAFT_1774976 [Infundibulicybe gibba]|nr:hypothetical protein BD779DRAFT_1774976 [Infundibulicybe gibba]